jgi:2-keto-myo-inositol isomerase
MTGSAACPESLVPRRSFLARSSAVALGLGVIDVVAQADPAPAPRPPDAAPAPWKYCLNTSTIQGQVVPLVDQIEVARRAGYDSVEVWLRDIDTFQRGGGMLADARKRIADAGLTVESAIAFAPWIVADDAAHAKAIDQAKRDMETIVAIGGTRIAAPPAGAVDGERLDLDQAGRRYRALLEAGRQVGCIPQLEVWGFSRNLSRLEEVLYVAAAARHPDACVLPDVYHLHKGGSNFDDLALLAGSKIHVFHVNDSPDLPRDAITDADRVYPGDGVAPLTRILRTVMASGFRGVLSLELFNPTYWRMPPLDNATEGLRKMRAAVERARAG